MRSYGGLKSEDVGNFDEKFAFLEKRPLTGKFSKLSSKRIHRLTGGHVVFKFREIWPTGNRWSRALFPWQKKIKFRLALPLSLLRWSRTKSAWAGFRQRSQCAPDFIQIGSLSAELCPNAWTPSERTSKWIQYSA